MNDLTIEHFGPALNKKPVVSVLMITYNHERFIRQAIESVFMQEVDFPIELVIGEDCSTDGTRAVIREVCRDAPISVKLLTSTKNVGMHANFRRTLAACQGEFIALLEGDDYWLQIDKLMRQVTILQQNPRIMLIAHRAEVVYDDTVGVNLGHWKDVILPVNEIGDLTLEMLSTFRFMIPTASVMVRKIVLANLPPWLKRLSMIDWYISHHAALLGNVHILPMVWSVYRVHACGVFSSQSDDLVFALGQLNMLLFILPQASDRDIYTLLRASEKLAWNICDKYKVTHKNILIVALLLRVMLMHVRYGCWPSAKTIKWFFYELLFIDRIKRFTNPRAST